jgi:hypothetical protein
MSSFKETAPGILSDAIRAQILTFIEDSLPTSKTLQPVKNGTDYCRRLRCVEWAHDLADCALLLNLPDGPFNASIRETIDSAARFLAFQRNEYFRLMKLCPEGGEDQANYCADNLRQMMIKEGLSAYCMDDNWPTELFQP